MTTASLTKETSIRVWDMSAGGCLLESREFLPVGTVGLLSMELDGRARREWFRICRVHANEGRRGMCLVAAEFLPLAPAGLDSLRSAIVRLRASGSPGGIPGLPGRSSGDRGKSVRPRKNRRAATTTEHRDLHETFADQASEPSKPRLATALLKGTPRPSSRRARREKE